MSDYYQFSEHPGSYAGKHPAAADAVIATGALVAVNSAGNAVEADSTITGHVVGRAEEGIDNTGGAAGDLEVLAKRGCYALELDDTNAPTKAHVGRMVYATAPDTVASVGTCRAGKLIGFDENGLAIVDTAYAEKPVTVTLTSTNGTAAAASANLSGLAAEAEKIGDDVRAIHAALVLSGFITA